MKQYQLKFCNERALKIYRQKSHALEQKHTTHALKLTNEQIINMLRRGEIKVSKNVDPDSRYVLQIRQVFDFSKHESDAKINRKVLKPALDKLEAEYDRLTAEITLGDEVAALRMLEAFGK